VNAHEEGRDVVLSAVAYTENFTMEFDHKIWLSNTTVAPGNLRNFRLSFDQSNKSHQKTQVEIVDPSTCEFPTGHPYRHGTKTRYSYLMASDVPHAPLPFQEIIKYDNELKSEGRKVWSARLENAVIGEPCFIPRFSNHHQSLSHSFLTEILQREEDDGWVICQLYLLKEHKTQFIILDAQQLDKGPIARLHLGFHIPYGFHGTFTPSTFF